MPAEAVEEAAEEMYETFFDELSGGRDQEEDMLEAFPEAEVQLEAEDIGKELPSTPAMVKDGLSWTSYVLPSSAAPRSTSSSHHFY